jgi:hypothetical protein
MMKVADKPNGPVAAAILAAATGVFTIGLMTTLNEASSAVNSMLVWVRPVGPLSGKTGLGVIVWVVAWFALSSRYRGKNVQMDRITRWSWVLIALGWLGTFPLFFERFAH